MQAVVEAAVQGVKAELEPRLARIERSIQDTSASTKQELRGMFADLKTYLASSTQPAGPVPAPAQPQAPARVPQPPSSPGK